MRSRTWTILVGVLFSTTIFAQQGLKEVVIRLPSNEAPRILFGVEQLTQALRKQHYNTAIVSEKSRPESKNAIILQLDTSRGARFNQKQFIPKEGFTVTTP